MKPSDVCVLYGGVAEVCSICMST